MWNNCSIASCTWSDFHSFWENSLLACCVALPFRLFVSCSRNALLKLRKKSSSVEASTRCECLIRHQSYFRARLSRFRVVDCLILILIFCFSFFAFALFRGRKRNSVDNSDTHNAVGWHGCRRVWPEKPWLGSREMLEVDKSLAGLDCISEKNATVVAVIVSQS